MLLEFLFDLIAVYYFVFHFNYRYSHIGIWSNQTQVSLKGGLFARNKTKYTFIYSSQPQST